MSKLGRRSDMYKLPTCTGICIVCLCKALSFVCEKLFEILNYKKYKYF